MRFSYGAIGWPLPLVEVVRRVAGLGFEGIEVFGLLEPLPEDRDLAKVLAECRVEVSAAYFAGSLVQPDRLSDELADFRELARRTRSLGGKTIVVGIGRIRHGTQEEDRNRLMSTVNRLGNIAAKEDVQLAVHPHIGTLICSPEEIRRVARETDPNLVKFAFDTAHLVCGGGDAIQLFREFLDRIACVHFKDLKEGGFVVLGKGVLPIREVYQLLKTHDYPGWITVELDSSPDPQKSAVENTEFVRQELKASLDDRGKLRP